MQLVETRETACTCPRAWTARATDGRPIHARLVRGWLAVGVGQPGDPEHLAVERAVDCPDVLLYLTGDPDLARVLAVVAELP